MFVDNGDMDDMEYYVEHVFAVLRELDAETSKSKSGNLRPAGQIRPTKA